MSSYFDYSDTPTKYIEAEGIRYAYRSLGKPSDIPIVCLQHFIGTLDNWDPYIINGLAREREVITIDNSGIGFSGGETPDNVKDMSLDVLKIINALGITKCDLLGFSLGGFIAQTLADLQAGTVSKNHSRGYGSPKYQGFTCISAVGGEGTGDGSPGEIPFYFLLAIRKKQGKNSGDT